MLAFKDQPIETLETSDNFDTPISFNFHSNDIDKTSFHSKSLIKHSAEGNVKETHTESLDAIGSKYESSRYVDLRLVSRGKPNNFICTELLHGKVVDINSEYFTASIYSDNASDNPVEVMEIPCDSLDDDDKSFLSPGAMFYLQIGHSVRPKQYLCKIRFQRLFFSKRKHQKAEKAAKHIQDTLVKTVGPELGCD